MTEPIHRVGLLAPPPNVVMETEFPRFSPPNLFFHTTRLFRSTSDVSRESLFEMSENIEQAAQCIAMVLPELIVFGCTSGSFILGLGWDRDIANRIEKASGVPAITTSTAVVDALNAIEAKRIFMVTPYIKEINVLEVSFLEQHGFKIAGPVSFELRKGEEIAAVPSRKVTDMVLQHRQLAGECDAIFISCTNLHTMDQIEFLEGKLQLPVITSNQATLWAVLKRIKASCGEGGGGLLRRLNKVSI